MAAEFTETAPLIEQILRPPPRTLIIIGGNAQKEVLTYISALNLPISIAPLGTDERDESLGSYHSDLTKLGMQPEQIYPLLEPHQINSIITPMLFLPGGDQEKLMEELGREGAETISNLYKNGGVIVGTSAGAMVMGEDVILGKRHGFEIFQGIGLIPQFIVDTHFEERDREERLLLAMQERARKGEETVIGLGISENTGVILTNENQIEVIGQRNVHLYFTSGKLEHRVLLPGDVINLKN